MWQSLNKNLKLIIIAVIVLLSIILVSLLRDSSQLIDKQSAMELIEETPIERAFVSEPYIYLHTKAKVYKVPKEAIDMDIFIF